MKYLKVLVLAGVSALAACQQKSESPAGLSTAGQTVIASVNGKPITEDFFNYYARTAVGKQASELTEQQREQVLDNLIRAQALAQQAEKDGVTKDPETIAAIEFTRLNVLSQIMSDRYLKDRPATEQELRTEYETQVAQLPQLEYRARHILVATEDFAKSLVRRLQNGADFAQLAARESMDGSKNNGGDLGWFTPDRMVKPFSDAVVALKPGEFTRTPVKTDYGWHIIRLEETRPLTPPPFDSVRQRLEQLVQTKKFKAYTDELLKTAKIEKPNSAQSSADKQDGQADGQEKSGNGT